MSDGEELQEASNDLQVNILDGLPDQDSACDDLNCPETLPLRDQNLDGTAEIDGAETSQDNADKRRVTRPQSRRRTNLESDEDRCSNRVPSSRSYAGRPGYIEYKQSDENWGETTTVCTGATSEAGFSAYEEEDDDEQNVDAVENTTGCCRQHAGLVVAGIVSVIAFISPIVMIILPLVLDSHSSNVTCDPTCEGRFVGFVFKLVILVIGSWALFFRKPKSTLPRIVIFRAFILCVLFIFVATYWAFYWARLMTVLTEPNNDNRQGDEYYDTVISFASSFVDILVLFHYLTVILLEIYQLQACYVVKLIRSPDGETHSYATGRVTIQQLAVNCLQYYYKDFKVYNPHLENLFKVQHANRTNITVYSVDEPSGDVPLSPTVSEIFQRHSSRREQKKLFDLQQEFEVKHLKRKARLLTAAEEVFQLVKRKDIEKGLGMDAVSAAQAMFPRLQRPMRKYLNVTRQRLRYQSDDIIQHLAFSISHDMSPKAFLEKFFTQGATIWDDKANDRQSWSLRCDEYANRFIKDGLNFQLLQGDVSLCVLVRKMPHFSLTEDVLEGRTKFELRRESETSV